MADRRPHVIKQLLRGRKKSGKRLQRYLYAGLTLALVLATSLWFSFTYVWQAKTRTERPLTVALVDELSGTFPDPSFQQDATSALVQAGYSVDYYGVSDVTVDFFRTIPSKGYGLIIIRAHSTGSDPTQKVTIFTSDLYSRERYVYAQMFDQLMAARLEDRIYFVITPKFVREAMEGNFPSSIIIMMGCTGLVNSEMAEAFVARGAEVYVSWDTSVFADRTDLATLALLRSLTHGEILNEAVSAAMANAGTDPTYGSTLVYYPDGQGQVRLDSSS